MISLTFSMQMVNSGRDGRIGFTKRGYDLRRMTDVVRNEYNLPMDYNGGGTALRAVSRTISWFSASDFLFMATILNMVCVSMEIL